jgi:hypothetical protein
MRTLLSLVLTLRIVAVPAYAQSAPVPGCTVVVGHKGSDAIVTRTIHYYACTSADGTQVPVSKAWFKKHKTRTYDGGANVDALAVAAKPGEKIAAVGFWSHVKTDLEIAGVGALVLILIAGGGVGAVQ